MTAYAKIYEVVCQIPQGKVATYGQIAELAQMPRHARLVGYALYQVAIDTSVIPWHRVVNAKGEVSYSCLRKGSDYLQRSLLEQEGVQFNDKDRINLRLYQWNP